MSDPKEHIGSLASVDHNLWIDYSKERTRFKVWSPLAKRMTLRLYNQNDLLVSKQEMIELEGIWQVLIEGDWIDYRYTYQACIDEIWMEECVDPYALGVTVNGAKGVVVDLSLLPDHIPVTEPKSSIVIYEASVRDFTIADNSNVLNKGKFLGLTEAETENSHGQPTGLSHLLELGITHLHLLPCNDFQTVDETEYNPEEYNWGYDPQHYNVPEGSYATDPITSMIRNHEFKTMVNVLHAHGLKVVLDVVYNHTYETEQTAFNQLVPNYYYRQWNDGSFSNGSGCGNELATERPMVRKFILDSLVHWVKNYDVDGFRFDLMALYDLETMMLIADTLRKLKPDILLYGEGWTADSTPLDHRHQASKQNALQTDAFAVFNDDFRDALKGKLHEENTRGFISGEGWMEESIKFGIVGACYHPQINYDLILHSSQAWSQTPHQAINYISCHDNHTLFDKLSIANETRDDESIVSMQRLGLVIILTSQGLPFLHAGSEFLRTKHRHHNSYNQPDHINRIDWDKKWEFKGLSDFVRELIDLRNSQSIFYLNDARTLQKNLAFFPFKYGNVVAFTLIHPRPGNDEWSEILVVFNGSEEQVIMDIPDSPWSVAIEGDRIDKSGFRVQENSQMKVSPFSATLLFKG